MGSGTRKLARVKLKNPHASINQAIGAIEKLQGLQELSEAIAPLAEDLKQAQMALSMVIQDMREADSRLEQFRTAMLTALRHQGLEHVVAEFEWQEKQAEKTKCPSE